MKRIGFRTEREVEIDGRFENVANRDAVFAKATVTIQGEKYRVAAIVSGPDRDFFLRPLGAPEREEALGWFALVHLAKAPSEQLKAPGPGLLAEVKVEIPMASGQRQEWTTIDEVRAYKDGELRDYETGHQRGASWSRWFARPHGG